MGSVSGRIRAGFFAATTLLAFTGRAQAYIDLAPTLGKIMNEAPAIAVVEVTAFDREARTITLKPIRALKGKVPAGEIRHQIALPGGAVPLQLLLWASPGNRGVLFAAKNAALVCAGTAWYPVRNTGESAWEPGVERPDLSLAYFGGVSRLARAVEDIEAGKTSIITTVAYGSDSEGAMFDIALNRQSLPGVVRVQRIRASKSMPGAMFTAASDPGFFVGSGSVDKAEIPALLEQLFSPESVVRAEAADDLGSLGRTAKTLTDALARLLKDPVPQVRSAAAGALLRIAPKDGRAIDLLRTDLASTDVATRRAAVAAAGFAGPSGAPLAKTLAALLKDPDDAVRLAALQSLSMLGPAADDALPALLPLLNDQALTIDAADAIGRIGPAARSAVPQLAGLLTSDQRPVQWAGVRAMAQIGGPDTHPAVDFMIKAMPKATEVEGYNLMIYLALIGPDAKDAAPKLPSFGLKNRGLTTATLWAISPDKGYPWKPGAAPGFGPFGMAAIPHDAVGFGQGGGMGNNMFGGLMSIMYKSYIHNLGPRLAPVAPRLATDITKDTAGDIPAWGYALLATDSVKSLAILQPLLASPERTLRERAAVALGYMGPAAAPARPALEAAAHAAPGESERRLMEWALRHAAEEN